MDVAAAGGHVVARQQGETGADWWMAMGVLGVASLALLGLLALMTTTMSRSGRRR